MRKQLVPIILALIVFPGFAHANYGDFSGGVAIGGGYAGVNTAPTNGLLVQGNVGIGTSSASDMLDIAGAVGLTTTAGSPVNGMYMPTANSLGFTTSGSQALNITATGSVGIGTTAPGALFDVNGSTIIGATTQYAAVGNTGVLEVNSSGTSSNGPQINLTSWGNQASYGGSVGVYHSRGGSVGIQGAVQSGDELGNFAFGGSDGSALTFSAAIAGYAGSTWTTSNHETYTVFYTSPNGSAPNTLVERMRITSAGNVGIGTISPGAALEVNGQVKVDSFGSATATTVCRSAAGVLSACSSSLRYKEKINPAHFGLKEVMEMRPVTFKWRDRDEEDFGLIAEDVEKVNPLFVTNEHGRIEGVKYPQLTTVLIKAVQEQQMEISDLQRKVEQLSQQK